jgi:hypothetical protein
MQRTTPGAWKQLSGLVHAVSELKMVAQQTSPAPHALRSMHAMLAASRGHVEPTLTQASFRRRPSPDVQQICLPDTHAELPQGIGVDPEVEPPPPESPAPVSPFPALSPAVPTAPAPPAAPVVTAVVSTGASSSPLRPHPPANITATKINGIWKHRMSPWCPRDGDPSTT